MKKFLVFLLMIFLSGQVLALGITPARATFDFEPNLKRTVSFEVINTDEAPLKISLSVVEGELSKYIKLKEKEISFKQGERSKKVSYDINLPKYLEAGLRKGEILIMESLPATEVSGGDSQVSARLAVVSQLHVYVPTPGKNIEAEIGVLPRNSGVQVNIHALSSGAYDVASARVTLDLYNRLGAVVKSVALEPFSLKTQERKHIVHELSGEFPNGEYLLVVGVIYDGESKSFEKRFFVGPEGVEVKDIKAINFRLGAIAKFEALIENHLEKAFSDAYLETKIFDKEKRVLSSFKSSQEAIEPSAKKVFTYYWDTAGFKVGQYETEVSFIAQNETYKKNVIFDVKENELNVVGLGYVVSSGGDSMGSTTLLLIVVIFILVAINIIWFLLIRKRLAKK